MLPVLRCILASIKTKKKINPPLLFFDEKFMLIACIWEIISVSLSCFPERCPMGAL